MKFDTGMIGILVMKDWSLMNKYILVYASGIIFSLIVLAIPSSASFYMGSILLLTINITIGFHSISSSIIGEKKENTVPFIMSLPISPTDYAVAKVLSNLGLFLLPWLATFLGLTALFTLTKMPMGILPFYYLICFQLLLNYVLVLGVSLILESEGWMIFTMVIVNLLLNVVIMQLAQLPEFNAHFSSNTFDWPNLATYICLAQVLISAIVLAMALVKQSLRRTFI